MSNKSELKISIADWTMRSAIAMVFLAGTMCGAHGEDWPQFRGPNGNGVVDALSHPQEWSNDKNIAWKVDVPSGLSSPVVVGDKVFLTAAAGPMKTVGFMEGVRDMKSAKPPEPLDFQVICLSLSDGKEIWKKTLLTKMPEFGIHRSNSFATASPVTDGQHVFVHFASIGLIAAFDLDGNEVWKKDIGAYSTGNGFGPGSSLAIHGDNVFVQCDNDQESFVAAFDKLTGDEAWRKKRDSRTSWATPFVWTNANRAELITCGSGFVTSYNPKTGDENWTVTGIDNAFSASPAADDQRIYVGNSGPRSNGPLLAIESTITGEHQFQPDGDFPGLAWSRMQSGPGMPSPVSVDGLLYITGRGGLLRCFDASNGDEVYKTRVEGLKSGASSFWADKGRIFILDEEGNTFIVQSGREYKLLGSNKLDGLFWSTPSVAGDSLLVRSGAQLICIRKKRI